MSLQNEMRRVRITNLEHTARRLRMEIEGLCRTICINLDCGLTKPESLPVDQVDSEWDELKARWGQLRVSLAEIAGLDEELK